jgi:hypothetical protein
MATYPPFDVIKPPLGLRPKYVADAMRAREILEAIERHISVQKPVPVEWMDELKALICYGVTV